ncbi:MAG: protein phosphatase 2C domain-containing protein [Planctomycetota bacterium]
MVSQSGSFEVPGGWLSGHSDFGPAGQDKDINQDRIVMWKPRKARADTVNWAIALADGVTSSWHSELAAGLACWSALKTLAGSDVSTDGRDALAAAVEAIRTAGVAYRRYGSNWCPDDEIAATWEYRLNHGAFLQTTLTLAWCHADRISVMRVGDGGAVLHRPDSADVLLAVDPGCHRVHALGPNSPDVVAPDDELSIPLAAGSAVALYTDGLARVAESSWGQSHLQGTCRCSIGAERSTARSLVRRQLQEMPDVFNDNLTLAIAATEC